MKDKIEILAVMFVDLSGYTALTEIHGPLEAFETADKFQKLAKASLSGNSRIVEIVGDEILFVSPSAEDLLSTIINLKFRALCQPNFLQVKAGLHYGEMMVINDRLYGNTVNLSARITARAQPSEVLSSVIFKDKLPANKQILFDPLGAFHFKNILKKVDLCRLKLSNPTDPSIGRDVANLSIDPVCHMLVNPTKSTFKRRIHGQTVHFCSPECLDIFDKDQFLFN